MQNVSLINSLRQPFDITNSVEKPKLPKQITKYPREGCTIKCDSGCETRNREASEENRNKMKNRRTQNPKKMHSQA